jgi:hypothetical protein
VRAKQAKKACPMCHRTLPDLAPLCPCGYEFGQPVERTLELLRRRKRNAKLELGIFIILDAGALFGMYEAALHGFVVFSGFVVVTLVLGTLRPIRKLGIARDSERLLAPTLLPTARVVE